MQLYYRFYYLKGRFKMTVQKNGMIKKYGLFMLVFIFFWLPIHQFPTNGR